MTKQESNVFFLCSGLGLGNSSRISAIIDELIKVLPQQRIYIFSWGKGFSFFSEHPEYQNINIVKLYSYLPPRKIKLDSYIINFLIMLLLSPIKYSLNTWIILKHSIKHRPTVVNFDSDYHFFPFIFKKGVTLLSLNQSYNVLANYPRFTSLKKIELLPSFLIECLDAIVQFTFAHKIFAPSIIRPKKYFFKKIISCPLIVRKIFLEKKNPSATKPMGISLSGSGIEIDKFIELAKNSTYDLITGSIHEVTYPYPKIMNYEEITCQGGLSTISEILSAKRKIHIMPMKGHCEQYSNFYDINSIRCMETYSYNRTNFLGSEIIAKEIIECTRN